MTSPLEIRTQVVNGLEGVAFDLRRLEATRLELLMLGLTALPPGEMELRAYRAEAALALGISEARTDRLLGLAFELNDRYPATLSLLREGRIDIERACTIADEGAVIGNITAKGIDKAAIQAVAEQAEESQARRHEYEQAILVHATELTPNRLRPVARRLAEQWAIESIETRQLAATRNRRVTIVDMDDGMAELRAYLPAVLAYGAYDHLTRIARSVKRGAVPAPPAPSVAVQAPDSPDSPAATGPVSPNALEAQPAEAAADTRGLDEIRSDALVQLLSQDPSKVADSGSPGVKLTGRVQLVLTADAVDSFLSRHGGSLGQPGERDSSAQADDLRDKRSVSCELVGYGPVSCDAARPFIAGESGWDLVSVSPSTGEVLSVDRYQPSQAMKRMLAARDLHCRFPGCLAPTYRSDIDHTIDAALGGPTATNNLAHLCRRHHSLKGNTDWTVKQREGGVLT